MWGNRDGIPMSVKSGAAKRRLFLLNLPCLPPIPPSIITKLWAKYKISIMLIYWLPCRPISPMQRVDGKKHLLSKQKLLSTSPIKGPMAGQPKCKKKNIYQYLIFPKLFKHWKHMRTTVTGIFTTIVGRPFNISWGGQGGKINIFLRSQRLDPVTSCVCCCPYLLL